MRQGSRVSFEVADRSSKRDLDERYRTVYVESYGCASNKGDIEIMLAILNKSGYHEVGEPAKAEVLLINTCAVKKTTEDRMLERLRRLGSYGKPIVVSGCLPKIDLPSINRVLPDYAALLDPASICRIAEVTEASLSGRRGEITFSDHTLDKSLLPKKRLNRFIEVVPISEGCSGACAYCCTRFARGQLFSYSPVGILERVKRAVSEGVVEIQITGQDTASYDAVGSGLGDLLREIVKIEGDFRVRVGMMNPSQVTKISDEVIGAYGSPKIYKFLHLPVQSGSDKLLALMNRRYKVADFISVIKMFRSRFPATTIATDVIVGFPSESEEDFEETQNLIKTIRPDVVNISKYAPRPGTSASKMKQLDSNIIADRSRRLARTAFQIVLKHNMRMMGTCEETYAIEENRYGRVFGRTHNYKKILVGERETLGKKLKVRITAANSRYLYCEVLETDPFMEPLHQLLSITCG